MLVSQHNRPEEKQCEWEAMWVRSNVSEKQTSSHCKIERGLFDKDNIIFIIYINACQVLSIGEYLSPVPSAFSMVWPWPENHSRMALSLYFRSSRWESNHPFYHMLLQCVFFSYLNFANILRSLWILYNYWIPYHSIEPYSLKNPKTD